MSLHRLKYTYISLVSILVILSNPGSTATYDEALRARKNGQFAAAEQQFVSLLKNDAKNAELWFQLGLVQRFRNKYTEAMASQKKALALSPANLDIRLELARLYHWKGEDGLAEKLTREVLNASPDYTDAQVLAATIEKAKRLPARPFHPRWQADIGHERSTFSRRPQPDWRQSFLQLGRWINKDTLVHFRTENLQRQNAYNEHYELGVTHIFNDRYSGYASVGYTPDSVFIPKWRIKAGGEMRILHGNSLLGDSWLTGHIQHDRYKTINTTVIKPGLRYAITDTIQAHIQHINVIDEYDNRLKGLSGRVDWQTPLSALRVFGGLSDAPETENALTVNTKARFIGLSYRFSSNVTVHASYAREDRDNSFIRHIGATALSMKF
ncbi:MAG: YaiO family outer membrane beta-barrel protein [Hyphomicrobiales bacterium]|nr:YaiO family outer membrane beta-barrel protein [Rickettsiales bacterium]MCP5361154.1 YaiO family outer membrane beta-barrel protein [Hyphomicrobiales bacterium]